ncbi:unnamed protein product, partial [Allacma fusca]
VKFLPFPQACFKIHQLFRI